MKTVMTERELIYSFLSRVYRVEVDSELLNMIKTFDYSEFNEDNDFDNGFKLLKKFIGSSDSTSLLELARDYAKTFIGAGMPRDFAAYPYESVYRSKTGLLMQDERDEVVKCYNAEMLDRSDKFVEPEDHIAFEFEFMAYLIRKTLIAIDSNSDIDEENYITKQIDFFDNHINLWCDRFANDVTRIATTDFYKAIAMITKGLLINDKEYLSELKK